ncbi:MFS transporter [Gaiella sp.]|uniref:MFS transporter n=1 Tax=Gaiella sp. TaxID=2663207 RepID=UPI002E3262D7|nr:MFS transporter [Gaiella sp.]HEX5583235.1 MFS transporter [Gaiella sp.]
MTRTRQHYGLTLGILTLGTTAYALQQTMVVPALTAFEQDLDASTTWVTWVLTGFLLSAAVLTPILGKLGDRYGKERLLVVSLGIFMLGCIGCALAPDIWTLIGARIVSGAGGAVFPLSFGIIRDEFPADKVKVGIGLLSAVFGIGGGFGLVVSGVIVDNASWRWMFVVGAAVTAVAMVLVHRFVPESPVRSSGGIDVPGAILFSVMLTTLLLGLSQGESWGWTSPAVLALFVGSALSAITWVLFELHVDEPLIDMRVLADRPVLLTNTTALIAGFAMFGSYVLVPRFVEAPGDLPAGIASELGYGFGASATTTGLYLLPGSVLMLFAGPIAGILGRRVGSKWPLAIGMVLVALSAAGLATLHGEPWNIVLAMAGLSVGVAFSFAAMAALITEAVEATETGIATGINTVMRTVGGVIGAQVGAALLTADTVAGTEVPAESAYVSAFAIAAVSASVAAVIAVLVTPIRRRGLRGVASASPPFVRPEEGRG